MKTTFFSPKVRRIGRFGERKRYLHFEQQIKVLPQATKCPFHLYAGSPMQIYTTPLHLSEPLQHLSSLLLAWLF